MRRALASLLACLLASSGQGCQGMAPPVSVQAPGTATLVLRLPTAPRTLQGIAPTRRARIVVEARDILAPLSQDVDLAAANPIASITQVPLGRVRVVTLNYLDAAGAVVPGLSYGGYTDVNAGVNRLAISDLTTVYSQIYLYWLNRLAQTAASNLEPSNLEWVVNQVLTTYNPASPRMLNVEAIAAALENVTSKNLPTPNPSWVKKPGYVMVRVMDAPEDIPLEFRIDDPISAPVVSTRGEPVLIGPLAPSSKDYKLRVTPLTDQAGPDFTGVSFAVSFSDELAVPFYPSVSLAKSGHGDALPGRVGGGLGVGLDNEEAMFIIGGLAQPKVDPVSIDPDTPSPVVARATHALQYTRAAKWVNANPLPSQFPLWGSGVVRTGNQVFVFGGQRNGVGSSGVFRLDLNNPTGQADQVATMPARLSEVGAGMVGGKIYIGGGAATEVKQAGGDIDVPFLHNLVFNPTTLAFEAPRLNQITAETALLSQASAVLDGRWYLIGGYLGNTPSAEVRVFDGTGWSTKRAMPTPRSHAAAVALGGKLWVIGGEGRFSVPSRSVEVYDPANDTWTIRAPLRTPRGLPAAAVVKTTAGQQRIVVAGGVAGVDADDLGLPVPADAVEELIP